MRNVTVVASGTAGAQLIAILFAPFITRMYGPEAFGHLGTFLAIVLTVSPLAALSYPVAIVLPKRDEDAAGLVLLSLTLSLAVASVTMVGIYVGGEAFATILGAQAISGYLLLIPLTMIFNAWLQSAQQWLVRKGEYGAIARVAIIQSGVINIAKVSFGWFYPFGFLLIVLSVIGTLFQASLLAGSTRLCTKNRALILNPSIYKSLRNLAYVYRDFPLYRAPQDIINAASQSLPVLMLAALFSPTAAGFYAIGRTVMGMPSSLVGKAFSDVFYPRIAQAANRGENLPQHIARATGVLFCIGVVPFGVVMLFGPQLFSMIFGGEWVMAGEYARWLALFFLFNFINKPSVAAVPVLGIQRGLLFYEIISTGGKALGLMAGFYWFKSDLWAIALFSILGVVAYSSMMLWIYSYSIRARRDAKAS